MQTTRLGSSDIIVSRLGFGCMGLSGVYGDVNIGEALSTIDEALDSGLNLFSLADFYGDGETERLIGRAVRRRRGDAVLTTKVGMRRDDAGRPVRIDGSPAYLTAACNASLRRLGVESIDLLVLCRLDPEVPIEDSVGAMRCLVDAGKVRSIGLSEVSASTLKKASAVCHVAALETEYSMWERHVEVDILPELDALGTALLAYSPLGRGFLAGAITSIDGLAASDIRRHQPRLQGVHIERNRVYVDVLSSIAAKHDASPAQIALAWLISRDSKVVAVPGFRTRAHLRDNLAAVSIELDDDDLRFLSERVPGQASGDRYPTPMMRSIDRD